MNRPTHLVKPLVAGVATALMLVACSGGSTRSDSPSAARTKLTQLQSDQQLASRAAVAIEDAERAVLAAEQPQRDKQVAAHLKIMADRKVDIAWARAQSRLLEDQRTALSEERDRARLEARTREADNARMEANAARQEASDARARAEAARAATEDARAQASFARTDADVAKLEADTARADAIAAQQQASESVMAADMAREQAEAARRDREQAKQTADAARRDAEEARRQAELARAEADDLQRQITELNAKATNRGLVVTLGDVLFPTGTSDLKGGAASNLDKLAAFLNRFEDRTVLIEGHTDSVGSADSNLRLSQRRADAVKSYLVAHGVSAGRLEASGKGELTPVASNDSSTGRQQNRRVEVIISNAANPMR